MATPEPAAAGKDARIIALIGTGHFLSHFYMLCLPPLFLVPLDDQRALAVYDQNVAALGAWRRFAMRFATAADLARLQRERRAFVHR